MADDNDTENDDTEESEEETEESEESLPKSKVNALITKEKRKATQAARKALADELGMSLDDAKTLLATQAEQKKTQMSEAEKLAEETKARLADVEKREAEAARATLKSTIESTLRSTTDDRPALREERLRRATQIVFSEVQESDEEDKAEALKEAVAALYEDSPEWFGTSGGGSNGSGSGVAGAPGRKGGESKKPGSKGADDGADMLKRYESRFGATRTPFPRTGQP